MKIRKLTLLAFAVITALATACSNDESVDNNSPKGIVIKATAGTPQGSADTRLGYTDNSTKMDIVWAANDKFTVYGGNEKHDYTIEGNGGSSSASFNNSADSWGTTPTGDVYALYPANITTAPTAITLSLENQKGTLDGLKDFNYMTASTTYSGTGDLAFGTFNHQVAIVKLVLTFPDGIVGNASNIGLKATGLNKSTVLNLTTGAFSSKTAGDVTTGLNTLTIADKQLTAYLCVLPGTLTNAKVIATVGSNKYEAGLPNRIIEARKMYTATVTMKKAVVAASIGDFYLSDNTIVSKDAATTEQKANCIGVVFWVNRNDATKGKIVSLDEGTNMNWSTENIATNAKDENDGASNTNTIKNLPSYSAEKYPPVAWCLNKGTGWYLPSTGELGLLYSARVTVTNSLNSLSSKGATPFNYNLYWASNEHDDTNAMFVYFDVEGSSLVEKQTEYKSSIGVRAILTF